ncbi:histidine kinase dimerization/phospho-acceptor domain-containing protein [Paenibacillus sp. JCM 10914]|uniref:histidine kinase dimerization/phospho-acceptor domain-containing protein n=1 Tax=Paenibacillus sp. JCM 10914 TaxID=1236974 RepID=UPI0003CC97C6|nr:histidine kinase dimerization/phospho-acceptor domain-containing protein [Paenibacillus sp. JCM 10914]GAE08211.1 sporulation kinase [Paenibacillus sp. JCM 10914]
MLITVASHAIDGMVNNLHLNPNTLLIMMLYMLIGIVHSAFIIYWIELTNERLADESGNKMKVNSQYLSRIMEMIPLGMVAVDHSGNIIAFNQSLLRSFKNVFPNLSTKDVIGRPLFDLLENMIQKEHLRNRFQLALQGIESRGEIMRSPSQVYTTGIYPLVHNENGEIVGAIGVMEDITELEKLRSEFINAERLSMVGQMAASITHEIRNPMAVVRGFLQLMREKSPDTLDHYYRIVMEELDRANGIINDFLSLAQNRSVEKEECHLHDIIQELSPLLWLMPICGV